MENDKSLYLIGLGKRMKIAREAINLTQIEFHEKFGYGSVRTFQKNEAGTNEAGISLAVCFVRAGINANWLMTGHGEILISSANEISKLSLPSNIKCANDKKLKIEPELQILCLEACSRLYGGEFDKLAISAQLKYANDLYLKLETILIALGRSVDDLNRLGTEWICKELENLVKLQVAKEFPYNPMDDIFRL